MISPVIQPFHCIQKQNTLQWKGEHTSKVGGQGKMHRGTRNQMMIGNIPTCNLHPVTSIHSLELYDSDQI